MKALKNWKRDFNQMNYEQYIQFFDKIHKYKFDKISLLKSFLTNDKVHRYDRLKLLNEARIIFSHKYFYQKLLMENGLLFIDLKLFESLSQWNVNEVSEKEKSIKLNIRNHTIKMQNNFMAEHPEMDFSHLTPFESSDKYDAYKGVWVNKN